MRREQINRRKLPRKRELPNILPLNLRDADVVHAKELVEHQVPPRRRAA